jgi:hypothetical protein
MVLIGVLSGMASDLPWPDSLNTKTTKMVQIKKAIQP